MAHALDQQPGCCSNQPACPAGCDRGLDEADAEPQLNCMASATSHVPIEMAYTLHHQPVGRSDSLTCPTGCD